MTIRQARKSASPTRNVPVFNDGDRLRKARTDAGLTQIELGAMIDMNDKTLASWERKAKFPSMARFVLPRTAEALNVDEHWLKTGHPSWEFDPTCNECTRRDSNPQPSDPKSDSLRYLRLIDVAA